MTGEARVDVGNLYRVLRTLEEQGRHERMGRVGARPGKRTYELTEAGGEALERWVVDEGDPRPLSDRHEEPRRGSLWISPLEGLCPARAWHDDREEVTMHHRKFHGRGRRRRAARARFYARDNVLERLDYQRDLEQSSPT